MKNTAGTQTLEENYRKNSNMYYKLQFKHVDKDIQTIMDICLESSNDNRSVTKIPTTIIKELNETLN